MWSLLLAVSASGATLEVCDSCPYDTMAAALSAAVDGDVIEVGEGVWPVAGVLSRDLTIQGSGSGTVLQCSGSAPLVRLQGDHQLAVLDLDLVACSGSSAVEVVGGRVLLEDVTLQNASSTALNGALLHVEGSAAYGVVRNATVDGLQTTGTGGVFSVVDGELVLQGGSFTGLGNQAQGQLVHVDEGRAKLLDVTVRDSTFDTSMVYITQFSTLVVERSTFANVASYRTAGIRSGGESNILVRDSTFQDLSSAESNGGAIDSLEGDTLELVNNRFIGNSTPKSGGVLSITRPTSLVSRRNLWCANQAYDGGAVFGGVSSSNSRLEFERDVFLLNQADQLGGAARIFSSSPPSSVSPGFSLTTFALNGGSAGPIMGMHLFNSGLLFDVRQTAFHATGGGTQIQSNGGGKHYLYDSVYADTTTSVQSGGQIVSGSTAAVSDLGFENLSGASCASALQALRAADGGVLASGSLGALLSEDLDGDGFDRDVDCNDDDPAIHPEQDEQCDDIDHDCNGDPLTSATGATIDLDQAWRDVDGDGYGDADSPDGRDLCPADIVPVGWVRRVDTGGQPDCDDTDPDRYPDAEETCDDDGADSNCDGDADDGATDLTAFYADTDEDGYGDEAVVVQRCDAPTDGVWLTTFGDCDDGDVTAFPGNDESCDDVDHNCDGDPTAGATDAPTWYLDADNDTWGEDGVDNAVACDQPAGFVAEDGDCDDSNPDAFPGAQETCVAADLNCDGDATAGAFDAVDYYLDADDDGYGASDSVAEPFCADPGEGWSLTADDCDESRADVHPNAEETCDAADLNCDGDPTAGATDAVDYYADADKDGFGDPSALAEPFCADPGEGWSLTADDCDESRADVHPNAEETCDAADLNCDGDPTAGATDAPTWHEDADGDGHGSNVSTVEACEAPDATWLLGPGDCDDADEQNYPGNEEVCDAADNNCDGVADEGLSCDTDVPGDSGVPDDSGIPVDPDQIVFVSGGCSSAPAPESWLWLLALTTLRRRTRAGR